MSLLCISTREMSCKQIIQWLLALSLAVGYRSAEASISQRFEVFAQKLLSAEREQTVSQKQLRAYFSRLLLPDSQYPQLGLFSWNDIQFLYNLNRTCQLQKNDNPDLKTAIDFERTLCRGELLPESWWGRQTLIHPAGGSYGDRYLEALRKRYGSNSKEVTTFLNHHSDMLTLKNSSHPLHEILSSLNDNGVEAILAGYHFFLAQDRSLWINYRTRFIRIVPSIWQPIARKTKLVISQREAEEFCPVSYGNICVKNEEKSVYLGWGVAALLFLIALVAIAKGIWQRQQNIREKKFVLQLLTHELRTPIASLGMTVEQFRDDYDQLSEKGQIAFARLLEDCTRLRRLTETSKGFLTNDSKSMLQCQPAMLSEWLAQVVDKYPVSYTIPADKELFLPWYWLGLCLDNLLRNAVIHGYPPIILTVEVGPMLKLEVQDQGQTPGLIQRLFMNHKKSKGMGIGLLLVKRIMTRIGGRLICQQNPTRYILELEYGKTAID